MLDALEAGFSPKFVVVHDAALDDAREGERLRVALEAADCEVMRAPVEVVNELSDTTTPQGVLAVLPTPSVPLPPSPSLVLVCDAVSDPGNLGTLLRSAAGAGVVAVDLSAVAVVVVRLPLPELAKVPIRRLQLILYPSELRSAATLRGWSF